MIDRASRERGIRRAHRISVAAGLVVIALVLVSTVASPQPCGRLPSREPPILAFELARSGDDLRAVFGEGRWRRTVRCRRMMVTAMDTVNVADLALFIPAYGAFLIFAFVGLRRRGRRIAVAGVVVTGVAMAADVVQDICQLGLTPALDPSSAWMAVMPWASGVKWLALGAAGAIAGVALWRGEERRRMSAALCMFTAIASSVAIADPARFGPLVITGVAASWAILFIDGLAQARARVET